MEIQNITGADTVPKGFSENSEVQNESENTQREEEIQREPAPEITKGSNLDQFA